MPDVTIAYKNSTITSLSSSGAVALSTAGKYLEDDLTITYTTPLPNLSSISIKPENCTSSSTQITPENYIYETDSSYPGTTISMSSQTYCNIGDYLDNNIKIVLNKTYHCVGQLFIKWDDDDTEEYYYIDSDFNTSSYNSSIDLNSFTWEGSTGATQTFGYMRLNMGIGNGYKTQMRPTTVGSRAITKSGVLLSGSFYRITQVDTEGYGTINLDFNSDPRFYGIYQSLAYRSSIASSAPYVSEWCNSLSSFSTQQFAGQPFSGNFTFNNVSNIAYYAFGSVHTGTQTGTWGYFGLNFPSCSLIKVAAFVSNVFLQSVFFPECTTIEGSAFQNCSRLITISFPKCTTISNNAFYNCINLTAVSFPSCASVGSYAFQNCSSLTTASFPECTTISGSAFYNCFNLTTISFPKCTFIGNYAFYGCSSLTTASFPECTTIGSYAFQYCSSLTTISFPECITISGSAFQNCSRLITISFPKCTTISNNAFYNCSSLTIVSFPECTTISSNAFYSCINLTTVSFPSCASIGNYAFYGCTNLTTASFPECTTISNQAFVNCSSLTTTSFLKCTIISNNAFQNCINLTTISFPECVTIGSYVFSNCSSLTTVSFPKCTSIGNYAFGFCSKLESAYFMSGSIPSIGTGLFNNTPIANSTYLGHFGSIYVPSSLLASYKTTTNWTAWSARMVGI